MSTKGKSHFTYQDVKLKTLQNPINNLNEVPLEKKRQKSNSSSFRMNESPNVQKKNIEISKLSPCFNGFWQAGNTDKIVPTENNLENYFSLNCAETSKINED